MTTQLLSTLSPAKRALLEQRLKAASRADPDQREIPRRPDPECAPLSHAQRQMWVIDQMTPGNPAGNLPYGYRLRGPLDRGALEATFMAVKSGADVVLVSEDIDFASEVINRLDLCVS